MCAEFALAPQRIISEIGAVTPLYCAAMMPPKRRPSPEFRAPTGYAPVTIPD